MLNARMVNVRISCLPRADFRESFAVFAPIPRFKKPFKYTRGSNLNHETVHFLRPVARGNFFLSRKNNESCGD
jgi:hypothetical protein